MYESQKKSINKYLSTLYDVRFRIPKSREQELKSIASDTFGMSLQQFILSAIDDKIATKLEGVEKFSSSKSEKKKEAEEAFYDKVLAAIQNYWRDQPGIEGTYQLSVKMSHNLADLLRVDARTNTLVTKEDIENVSKPSKTMYYAIYVEQPDQSQQILCVSPSIYITSEDLEKYGITRHDVMTINRLIAYQQGILGMSTKYKNGAEQKRAESILTDMGIPYSKYILPIDKKGNECCDGDEIYLPDGFWNEAWGLYVELYHPQN